ncbi:Ig-like domain-containing protein [Gallibacterium anatis]|uniref:Ig-like domain-containing protein n=1 Tax=Gallibacterium anatis TaxID=750 RepID=UPI002230E7ED|nr:Ig-like domain-containing protein [Gallibacterium anatis]UZD15158.1 Ig-like domain-containing protein [Gallibacterium anatis]
MLIFLPVIFTPMVITADKNGDNILSSKELGDDAHFATVKIHLKDGAKAGDMVVVNGANGFALTDADIKNGFVEVPVLVREGENPLNIIAYNAEGQKDQLDESFSFTVDTEAPSELEVNPIEDVAKDEAITISGTADPGSTITVKLPNGETSTTQATDGTWSIDIPAEKAHDIADGEVKVTVEASDEAGNIASKDTSFNLDTQTPTVELAVDKSNGTVSLSADEDLYLNGNKVYDKESNTITDPEAVKNALGDQVTIKDGQLLVDPNAADDITLTLDNISDKAGNATSANATLEARPTVTVKADTTALTADTNSTDITLTFSEAVTGFDISDIEVSGGTLSNFHQDSENPFIYHVTFTAEDNNTLNASVAVKDGSYQSVESTRVGKGTEATTFTGDTLAPVAPEIALVKDAGFYDYNGITNISQMLVSNLEEGASWQYSTDGGKTWKNGSGTSFNLNDGEYKVGDIIVKQTDAADNSGEKVFGHDVTIDTVSPDVQIKGFVLSGHSDPVWNLTAGTYKDLLLTGTSEPGSKVELVLDEDDQESGLTAMTDATGKWSIHIPADQAATILNGSSIQVNALDIAGNTVSTSKSVSINEPYEGQVINQINVIAGDDMINVEEARFNVEINGYASKAKWNDLVYFELYNVDKSKPVDNIKFDSTKDNNWTLALSPEQLAQLADGHYRLDVYDDRSGTSLGGYTYSNLLTSREFMIDRSIVAPGAEVDGDKDEAEDKVLVNTVQPTWHNPEGATAEPNAQITIKVDGKVVGSTTSSAEGTWLIKSNSTLADGNHQVEITITDKAGNTATSSQALTVDTQAPQLTVDPITGDNRLSDNEAQQGLTITGTGEAGATILVKVGESEAVETTVNSDGSWAVTVNKDTVGVQVPTEGGDVTVTVTSTDKAGNSTTQDITVGYYQANNLVELSDNGLDQTQSKALNLNGEGVYYLEQPQALLTTSNGDLVQWQGAGTDTLIGMANGKEVIRIHVDNQGSYEVVQHQAVQHGARGSATDYSLNLDVPVYRIADGQTSQQWLTLQIKDAQPELVGQEKALTTADNVIDGQALKAVSPDGLQTFSVQLGEAKMDVDLDTYQATISGGEIFSYRVEQGENPILFLSTKAGETLRLNLKTGEYQYRIPSTDVSEDVYDQPEVNIGGSSSSLLNTVNLNVAGLAKFENQQAFSVQGDGIYSVKLNMWAVDVGGLLGTLLGDLKKWTYNERLAEEFGLKVNVTPMVLGLSPTILTITAKDGSELDTDRVNQLLATVGTEGGLSKILTVGLLPTTWMEAFDQNGDKLDSSYGGTSLANVGLLNDALSGEAESNTFVDVDGKSSTMDHRNATDNLFIYGLDGKDHLVGGSGSDRLYGGQGDDILEGGSESDLLVGGKGNDTLTGGLGSDVFRWEKDDQVSAKGIATDVVTDFNAIGAALGGDVLDLSRLLVGAGQIGATVGNLLNYLHFSYDQSADQTILYISTQGRFIGGFQANNVDQIIQLKGVDLTSLGDNDLEIIETLIAQGSLVVDHIQGEALPTGDGASRTITIGVTDKDGDHQEAKVTADTSGVDYDQNTFNPDNQAPLVFGRENDLLGIIGLDALQILKLNKQDIYVFDPDNNLASVDIRYLQVLGVDVTPSTFGWSEQLAKELGLKVSLENKKGVLGLIAPSVTLHITAQDGGVIDNVKINQFLASVRFGHANSEGILDVVNGDVLSLDLLNGMRITATDYQGAQTEKPLLSLLDLDLLGKNHTLNGDVHLVEGDAEGNDWDRSNSDNSEIIYGYAGDDTITTNHLGNVVYGGTGNDIITGGLGNDNLYGGDDNDTLKSTGGTDYLFGEAGDDQLYGNTSFGTVFVGGSGSDTYHSVAGVRDTVILQAEDLGTGVDDWQGFAVGNMLNADADVLDLSALLQSKDSLFDKERADLLSESNPDKYLEYMQEFIKVEQKDGDTTIAIDLDGAHHETKVKQSEDDKNPITVVTGDKYQYSDAITLDNVTSTLDDLLKNQQIIY